MFISFHFPYIHIFLNRLLARGYSELVLLLGLHVAKKKLRSIAFDSKNKLSS